MTPIWMIVGAAAVVYLCRGSGFAFKLKSASWEQFFHYVPIAVFSALVVLSTTREPELLSFKLLALACAGFVMWRTRQFALAVVVGLGALWLLLNGSPF